MIVKKIYGFSLAVFIAMFSFFVFNNTAIAAEMNFSVNTVVPDNQIDKSKTYFNLKMNSNQQQDITVTLKNDTKKISLLKLASILPKQIPMGLSNMVNPV